MKQWTIGILGLVLVSGIALATPDRSCGIEQGMKKVGIVQPTSTQPSVAEPFQLLPFRQKGKWGYINSTGHLVIPPQFALALHFSEGLAAVKLKGKWGYINSTGHLVIPATFEQRPGSFSDGLAWVKLSDKVGYINTQGILVIAATFQDGRDFQDGQAEIRLHDGECNWIDQAGKPLNVQPIKSDAVFQEGLAWFVRDNRYGFIDRTGKIVIPAQFAQQGDDIFGFTYSSFSEGVAPVNQKANGAISTKPDSG